MGEIVNLRLARKARTRTTAEKNAAQNRAKFGLTKAEKVLQREEATRQRSILDGAKREQEGEG
jgi:hypothetical protein